MHQFDDEVERLAEQILEYSLVRLKNDPPLDGPKTPEELEQLAGQTITAQGLGGEKTLNLFKDVLARACISTDHPRYLAFIPSAPSEYSNLFDLVVGASALYGGSWLEGAGAVFAENQALRWLSDLAGMPKQSGGVFVQGGTIGNLSALVVARDVARKKNKDRLDQIRRWVVVASAESHASIKSAADVMDVQLLLVKPNQDGVLTGELCEQTISDFKIKNPGHEIFAIVATAGSTNLGIIDDLKSVGDLAKKLDIWFHIDGAYGLAALCSPTTRKLFAGVEMCDSFIVDPHKWLFTPFDCCALVYRNPKLGAIAHTQHGEYLDTLTDSGEWNPSDYAIHLTRRARGLPFWFSLAANGTKEYTRAMEHTLTVAREAARLIKANK